MIPIVIFTHQGQESIHLDVIESSNHGAVSVWQSVRNDENKTAWANCDRNIRDWWKSERESKTNDHFLLLEWDVFLNVDADETIPSKLIGDDCVAASVLTPYGSGRSFKPFRTDSHKMPLELRRCQCGIVPLGCLYMSRIALDALCDQKWDSIMESDVFSELRIGSILRSEGFAPKQNPLWNRVTISNQTLPKGFKGIAHKVKSKR
jgi:hypothetical protein